MIISKIYINKFRKFHDLDLPLGAKLTVIAGQNGTMKTTLLGLISQPFSMTDKSNPMTQAKTIDGYTFESKFSDKFKFSMKYEKAGDHSWRIYIADSNVYQKEYYEAESIERKEKGKANSIRIWSAEGRKTNMGYIQCPVIYLSLKRLIPIGEEKQLNTSESNLTEEEFSFYKKYHSKILLLDDKLENIEYMRSSNKSSLGVKTNFYDSLTNSAGQDNIGKILLSVLSFKRLKEGYPEYYRGGILLIDEIDATMFPRAQEKLIESLYRFASDYKLQIIITTHSQNVIKIVLSYNYNGDTKLLYFRNRSLNVIADIDPNYEKIKADLSVETVKIDPLDKIRVYCEDAEAYIFLEGLLSKNQKKSLQFMRNISLGCGNLKQLAKKKVPEFCKNIVILDGDNINKLIPNNFCILPGNGSSPEKLFFSFLKKLPDTDDFWNLELGGYMKQICFEDYYDCEPRNRDEYKKWFNNQKGHWGVNCTKLLSRWKKENADQVKSFIDKFCEVIDYLDKNR